MKHLMMTLGLLLSVLSGLAALPDGDYLYSFSRTTDFPELERQYKELGIVYRTLTIERITGMVVTVRNGRFTDPSISLVLEIDAKGDITSPGSGTVTGFMKKNGSLAWSGFRDHYQQKARMVVRGTLVPITAAVKAGTAFDGTYLLEEEIGGRKMAARIKGGYLTFEPLDRAESDGPRSGWPVLVGRDGTILSVTEFITRVEVTGSRGDSSTFLTIEGKAAPGALSLMFMNSNSVAADTPGTSRRRVYGGQRIQEAELGQVSPDPGGDAVPEDRIPGWFLNPDNGPDWIAASGCLRLGDRESALRGAETVAAANLSFQISTRVKSAISLWTRSDTSGEDETLQVRMETVTDQITFLPLDYRVIRSEYDDKTGTAWVMVAIEKRTAGELVSELFEKEQVEKRASTVLDEVFQTSGQP